MVCFLKIFLGCYTVLVSCVFVCLAASGLVCVSVCPGAVKSSGANSRSKNVVAATETAAVAAEVPTNE